MASTSRLKVVTFGMDLLCTLLALVLVSFGIYVVVSYDHNAVGSLSAYAYVGLGVSALVIVLWGHLSTWRKNVCCTITFTVFLFLVIVAQLTVVILLFSHDISVASNLSNPVETTWEEELNSPGAMSLYQNWFQCCGRSSPQDYIINDRLPPNSCFLNHDNAKNENLILTGCRVELENYWLNLLSIFNILACALIGVELLLGVIYCLLCNKIRRDASRT
ncbi:23 kDa integral membrane protein-like [Drosophila bipectinata]|uniref:23 kDa integral membrane protein-like n=1 Tax=Drosophila bipectinata TaxID=42026 RepID=UPI0007E7408A|nr:23 kDa integral membrane protein-like [Drosophila bipectinata]